MKTSWTRREILTGVALAALPLRASARSARQVFTPNVTLRQWRQRLEERAVKTITAEVQRTKGSNKTFINARFHGETTFEGGRRVYLPDTSWMTVTWTVNRAPNGKELVFNAYDGEALLRKVTVEY
jgi:hypothetical protein